MTFYYDVVSVALFSISGTLTAYRYQKLDAYGLAFVALITAIGGGTVRDILIDSKPIAWVHHSEYIVSILIGFVFALAFKDYLMKIPKVFRTVDALAISFSSIAGVQKSLELGASVPAAILFGAITATTGGLLRDVICREVPMVLRKEIYASACLAGGLSYALLFQLDAPYRAIVSMLVVATVRLVSVHLGWNLELSTLASVKSELRKGYKKGFQRLFHRKVS